jgi:phthalate 4,5-dioxygenase reductase subunit
VSETNIEVVVAGKVLLAPAICRFELEPVNGTPLPSFTAGAHINVQAPNGMTRSYSLTDSPNGTGRYAITVAREQFGRGGSLSMIEDTRLGGVLQISAPLNTFPLVEASDYLFVAGGIGITPIRAMVQEAVRQGAARVRLVYLSSVAADTAYLEELRVVLGDDLVAHHSVDSGHRLDLWPYLAEPGQTHVYCCGPIGLMDEVEALTMHWNPRHVHFEDFAGSPAERIGDRTFAAVWRPTGQRVEVPGGTTLMAALRAEGIKVDGSCLSGTCGTCTLRLLAGDPDHRDIALAQQKRTDRISPCVSRALSATLELAPLEWSE